MASAVVVGDDLERQRVSTGQAASNHALPSPIPPNWTIWGTKCIQLGDLGARQPWRLTVGRTPAWPSARPTGLVHMATA